MSERDRAESADDFRRLLRGHSGRENSCRDERDNESFRRDGRRMILKRRRPSTISRLLLVHERAVCRLTYDRQQLINAFMSIRLAVQRRFKPRPVQPNPPTHPSAHLPGRPTNQPPIQPLNERDKLPTPLSFSLSPSLSLSLSLSLASPRLPVSRYLCSAFTYFVRARA